MLKGEKAPSRRFLRKVFTLSTEAFGRETAEDRGKTLRWRRSAREDGPDGRTSGGLIFEDPRVGAAGQPTEGEEGSRYLS
jgi:hypothetical protein